MLPYAIKEKSVEERFKVFSTITPATIQMDATVIGKINRQTSGGANDETGFFDLIRWPVPANIEALPQLMIFCDNYGCWSAHRIRRQRRKYEPRWGYSFP